MEAQCQAHPTPRQLAAFGLGKLTPDGQKRMQEHLASCERCAAFTAGTPHDTLVNLLRQAASNVSSSDQSTPAVRDSSTLSSIAAEKLAERLPSPAASSSAPQAAPTPHASSGEAGSVRQPADESIPLPLREQTKYRIGRLLGRGGMGAVYEAYHERMARKVALKIIAAPLLAHPDALKRFEQEVRAAANLDHPNLARAYDADVFGDLHVLVMEYVTGRSLDKMLADAGPMSVQQACQCAFQTAQGLQHAHQRGMVHRDLKPANLMLTAEGRIKILDFGLAKLNQEQSAGSGLTRDHALMGTPAYLAPEQALDAAKADIRADIYSLGCTLYALVTGAAPFVGDTEMKILLAHQNERHRPLVEVRPDVPRELSDFVDRMLAKNPADRPQTPADVAQALLPFARGAAAASSRQVVSQPVPALATVKVPLDAVSSTLHGARATTVAHRSSNSIAGAARRVPPIWRWAGIALAGFVLAVWAAVIALRTPTGTIVVERVPADAEVLVDGQAVTLKRTGEEVTIAAVTQGDHRLRLSRDGVDLWTNDISIRFAGEEVRVRHTVSEVANAPVKPRHSTTLNNDKPHDVDASEVRAEAEPNVQTADAHAPNDDEAPLQQDGAATVTKTSVMENYPDAEISSGEWKIQGDELISTGARGTARLIFGDPTWSEYDFSFAAKQLGGKFGFQSFLGVVDAQNRRMFEVGAFSNVKHLVVQIENDKWSRRTLSEQPGTISFQEFHTVRIEVRRDRRTYFLDGKQWLNERAENPQPGRLGFGTARDTSVCFRDIRVTSLDGNILWQGSPRVPNGQQLSGRQKQSARPSATASSNPAPPAKRRQKFDKNQGKWERVQDELRQTSQSGIARLLLGDKEWSRYVLTLQARLDYGEEGIAVYCNLQSDGFYKLQLGCVGNTKLKLFTNVHYRSTSRSQPGTIEADRWYDVEILVDNGHIRCRLDDEKIFEKTENQLKTGRIAIGSVKSAARFRNIKVTSLDGKRVLWEGPATVPGAAATTHPDDDSPDDGTTDEPEGREEPPASQTRNDRTKRDGEFYRESLVGSHGTMDMPRTLVATKIRDHGISPRSEN